MTLDPYFLRRRGFAPMVPGLVRMDRALIYIRQQLRTLIVELSEAKTKSLGEQNQYRVSSFVREVMSLCSMAGDTRLADDVRATLGRLTSRAPRVETILLLRELSEKLDTYEEAGDFEAMAPVEPLPQAASDDGAAIDVSAADSLFVIMPFSADFGDVWRGGIQRASEAMKLRAIRVDSINRSTNITDDIVSSIEQCRLAIVDVTGNNPNVMFELGYALAKGKRSIIISQSADYLPFDIRNIRTLVYANTWSGIEELNTRLQDFLRESVEKVAHKGKKSAHSA